jgi:hypothetical protein
VNLGALFVHRKRETSRRTLAIAATGSAQADLDRGA